MLIQAFAQLGGKSDWGIDLTKNNHWLLTWTFLWQWWLTHTNGGSNFPGADKKNHIPACSNAALSHWSTLLQREEVSLFTYSWEEAKQSCPLAAPAHTWGLSLPPITKRCLFPEGLWPGCQKALAWLLQGCGLPTGGPWPGRQRAIAQLLEGHGLAIGVPWLGCQRAVAQPRCRMSPWAVWATPHPEGGQPGPAMQPTTPSDPLQLLHNSSISKFVQSSFNLDKNNKEGINFRQHSCKYLCCHMWMNKLNPFSAGGRCGKG